MQASYDGGDITSDAGLVLLREVDRRLGRRECRRVVFYIKGNDYRLIAAIAYKLQIVYVKFVGTHREYDAETVEMT